MTFAAGDKVHMAKLPVRGILRGFIEQVGPDYLRIRWEDCSIGVLVFDWQIARLLPGWPDGD